MRGAYAEWCRGRRRHPPCSPQQCTLGLSPVHEDVVFGRRWRRRCRAPTQRWRDGAIAWALGSESLDPRWRGTTVRRLGHLTRSAGVEEVEREVAARELAEASHVCLPAVRGPSPVQTHRPVPVLFVLAHVRQFPHPPARGSQRRGMGVDWALRGAREKALRSGAECAAAAEAADAAV